MTTDSNRSRVSVLASAFLLLALAGCAGGDTDADPATDDAASTPEMAEEAMTADATGGALLDPNTAGEEALSGAPGITPDAAAAILEGRPFPDMTALDAAIAAHMDEVARETLYGHVWIPLDLNTASSEEIGLIPGVGDRMTHEFEEYRPYTNMEQFRREIGKYVDEAEVARLERYVTIAGT